MINFFEREVRRLLYIQGRKKIRLQEKAGFDATQIQTKPKTDEPPQKTKARANDDPALEIEHTYKKIERE